jgi:hypothetical protein
VTCGDAPEGASDLRKQRSLVIVVSHRFPTSRGLSADSPRLSTAPTIKPTTTRTPHASNSTASTVPDHGRQLLQPALNMSTHDRSSRARPSRPCDKGGAATYNSAHASPSSTISRGSALPPFTPPTTRETDRAHVPQQHTARGEPERAEGTPQPTQQLYDPGVCLGGPSARSEARPLRGR